MFERAGWIVCAEADDGREAVNKAGEARPDIIVLDLSMPCMNGLTAGRILNQILPNTPLILFTSFGAILSSEDLKHAGFSALIDKNDAQNLVSTAQALAETRHSLVGDRRTEN
jgi:CheY-like chemotaxis protein